MTLTLSLSWRTHREWHSPILRVYIFEWVEYGCWPNVFFLHVPAARNCGTSFSFPFLLSFLKDGPVNSMQKEIRKEALKHLSLPFEDFKQLFSWPLFRYMRSFHPVRNFPKQNKTDYSTATDRTTKHNANQVNLSAFNTHTPASWVPICRFCEVLLLCSTLLGVFPWRWAFWTVAGGPHPFI